MPSCLGWVSCRPQFPFSSSLSLPTLSATPLSFVSFLSPPPLHLLSLHVPCLPLNFLFPSLRGLHLLLLSLTVSPTLLPPPFFLIYTSHLPPSFFILYLSLSHSPFPLIFIPLLCTTLFFGFITLHLSFFFIKFSFFVTVLSFSSHPSFF